MKYFFIKSGFYIALFCYILLNACGEKSQQMNDKKSTMLIVTTTGMIADIVSNIVQEKAKVEAMMGPGVDPHLYKATPNDLQLLRNAQLIFYNGLHLEGKMAEILEKFSKQKPVFPISDGISRDKLLKLGNDQADAYDPHIWFDVLLWKEATTFVLKKLVEIDKDNAQFYQKNANAYLTKLENLHQEIKIEIQKIPLTSRVLITAHDAFGYFGKAYQIEVRGLQGISTVSEFGLKDVADLVNFIVSRKIKAVFVESSISPKSLEAVVRGCQQKGHTVRIGGTLYSDAMGEEGSKDDSYIGMIKSNIRTIVQGLK